jgi:phenylacetate-CoA ligase
MPDPLQEPRPDLTPEPALEPGRIPADVLRRHPSMTREGYETYRKIHDHPHAPHWNYTVGDRVTAEDLERAAELRDALRGQNAPLTTPSSAMIERVQRLAADVYHYRETLPARVGLEAAWPGLPTLTRQTLRERVELLVPINADLSRIISYATSGTTGPSVLVPTHPSFNAQNQVLGEYALRSHGVSLVPRAGQTACIGVSAQASTYTFATIFSVWNGAGFAKVNLKASEWPDGRDSARAFFDELAPLLLTGEPVSFAEAMAWQLPVKPMGLISTATALAPALQQTLARHFGCPVLDWYSLSETGPIAFSSPDGQGMRIFPGELLVEILDSRQRPVPLGQPGEIVVTTFRNPYLPLLRYRTGDHARLVPVQHEHGVELRLMDLVARRSACFRTPEGHLVNPVDIARVLNAVGIYQQHECIQRADGSIDLGVWPLEGMNPELDALEAGLREYFGAGQILRLRAEASLPGERSGKRVEYRSEQ